MIVWLASYPKSGNTWVRVLLANYDAGRTAPVDINELEGSIASSRDLFDEHAGVEASELTRQEVERYRPDVYRHLAAADRRLIFLKTHDAFITNVNDEPIFPADVTRVAVYIVRNPLDVAVSFAHHNATTIDRVIGWMARPDFQLAGTRQTDQLPQRLLSWSGHVSSWCDQTRLPVCIVRYEDLLEDTCAALERIVSAAGLDVDAGRLSRAVEWSRFDDLQKQEIQRGFIGKPARAERFFRAGRAGDWRTALSSEQVAALIGGHGPMMKQLGYLNPS